MGLGIIPKNYPCETNGTAVIVTTLDHHISGPSLDENGATVGQINCDDTAECGGCPWRSRLGSHATSALSLMGTRCWYRGTHGAYLLSMLDMNATALYGDDNNEVTAPVLKELVAGIDERVDYREPIIGPDGDDLRDDYRYLRDWLAFAADECDGAETWEH